MPDDFVSLARHGEALPLADDLVSAFISVLAGSSGDKFFVGVAASSLHLP